MVLRSLAAGTGRPSSISSNTQPEAASGALAIAAGIAAPMSYGIASLYAKSAKSVPAFANAHGSMWGATAKQPSLRPHLPHVAI